MPADGVKVNTPRFAKLAHGRVPMTGSFLKLDVAKFYDSVNHELLRAMLQRRFREGRLLRLFDCLLDSYCTASSTGIPIGALTSQYLGNFYLDTFDRWVKQELKVKRYARYMDDMVFWGTQSQLRTVLQQIHAGLDSLYLRVTSSAQLNRCNLGLPFLGFVVYPDRLRLNCTGKKRVRRRIRELEQEFVKEEITELELQQRGQALFAHAAFADDVGWRRMVASRTLWWES